MRRLLIRLAPLSLGLALACQDYEFEQQCPDSVEEVELVRPAARPIPADILFVVDDSGSMEAEQNNLADNFGRFIAEVSGDQKAHYRLGVVTTDQDSPGGFARAGRAHTVYADTYPHTWITDDRAECVQTDVPLGCFRGPVPDLRIIDSRELDRDTQIQAFRSNVRVGSCGSAREMGLAAMRNALGMTDTGACNAGFMRSEANLVIVFVSDEEDADNVDVDSYVNELVALKRPDQIRVAAIVGSVDGNASRCRPGAGATCGSLCQMTLNPSHTPCAGNRDCSNGNEYCDGQSNTCENRGLDPANWSQCDSCSFFETEDCCSAKAGGRYVEFARALEQHIRAADPTLPQTNCRASNGRSACLVESICQDDFGDTLARIARELIDRDRYVLDPPAENPQGVRVWLRGGRYGAAGKELVNGESYTVEAGGGLLHIPDVLDQPQDDERLDITYVSESGAPGQPRRGACQP